MENFKKTFPIKKKKPEIKKPSGGKKWIFGANFLAPLKPLKHTSKKAPFGEGKNLLILGRFTPLKLRPR